MITVCHEEWFVLSCWCKLVSAITILVTEGIIRPVVCVLTLTWFITYVCYLKLQFLNNVIIFKNKVLLPHAFPYFGDHVYALWFTCSQNLKLFGFPIFRLWAPFRRIFQKRVARTKLDIYVLLPLSLLLFCHFWRNVWLVQDDANTA